MTRWEYNVVKAIGVIPHASLNRLGLQGWEMVSAVAQGATLVIYLKRELPPLAVPRDPHDGRGHCLSTCDWILSQSVKPCTCEGISTNGEAFLL